MGEVGSEVKGGGGDERGGQCGEGGWGRWKRWAVR